MELPVANRKAAGQVLAEALRAYRDRDDVIVLGLPRGGVPVAMEVAIALGVPLDLILVRKLGTPGVDIGSVVFGKCHNDEGLSCCAVMLSVDRNENVLSASEPMHNDTC
jgi:predicted phosphoribosyltransferase